MVVDERVRLPIGRPWLTLAIDVASRTSELREMTTRLNAGRVLFPD
jgi:hypothetical protein